MEARIQGIRLLFAVALAVALGSNASASFLYINASDYPSGTAMDAAIAGVAFSTVPADGYYDGQDPVVVVDPMEQTGPALGGVTATNGSFMPSVGNYWYLVGGNPGVALRVDFQVPASAVSVRFVPDDRDTGVLQVYSPSGALLEEIVGRNTSPFTLSYVAQGTPVSYLLASFGDTGYIDQIGYDRRGIPAPGALALIVGGLMTMTLTRAARRTVT
jgi:hypothetical protein